jgi:hypothetical protein
MGYYQVYRGGNKYKNVKMNYGGNQYRSKLEVYEAMELDQKARAKEIVKWERERCIDIFFVKEAGSSDWTLKCFLQDSQDNVILGSDELSYKHLGFEVRHFRKYYIDFVVWHLDGDIELVETKGLEFEPWKNKWFLLELFCDQCPNIKLTVKK